MGFPPRYRPAARDYLIFKRAIIILRPRVRQAKYSIAPHSPLGRTRFPHYQQGDVFVELPGETCAGSFGEHLTLECKSAEIRPKEDGQAPGSTAVSSRPWVNDGRIAPEASPTRRGPFTALVIRLFFLVDRGDYLRSRESNG